MRVLSAALMLFCAVASPSAFSQGGAAAGGGPSAFSQGGAVAGGGPSASRRDTRPLVEEYRFGTFTSAEAISADRFGNVFVLDAAGSSLQKFDLKGTRLAETGGPGWGAQQFDRPTGIDARPGIAVYVADMGNNRVSRFDRDLNFMAALRGDDGTIDPGFGYPLDVAQSSLEQLFILDGENNRVLALRGFNTVERVFGGIESGDGRLQDPVALGSNGSDLLFVLESDRVAVFDHFGSFLRQFGRGHFTDAQGIAVDHGVVLVVTTDALQLYADDGTHLRGIGRDQLVLAGESGEFRDAVFAPPYFLLLTTHHCILFPAEELARGF
jgi:hypothetical protein